MSDPKITHCHHCSCEMSTSEYVCFNPVDDGSGYCSLECRVAAVSVRKINKKIDELVSLLIIKGAI